MARRIGGRGGGSDPGSGKAGVFVTAAVLAGAVAGGSGALGGAGSTGGAGVEGAGQNLNLNARKGEAKSSAKKGNADEAWQKLNMRTLKKVSKQHAECVTSSFGQVRDYFLRNPCASLDRMLFGVGDGQGNVVVVSVVWVGFRSRADARGFRDVENVHGSGDVSPLGSGLLGMADIRFTGDHYHSRPDGTTVVIAETETATGQVDANVLNAMAEVAAQLPRP